MEKGHTGTRIRDRRILLGIKQAELARAIGISASYLNLIEHNRRRIGGKVLLAIARKLEVDPQTLTEGAEATLIAALREAASDARLPEAEASRADEFAERFPGWAEVLVRGRRQIAALERTVEELTERLAHDPRFAASMHELLGSAAAVRSTAAILAENEGLEPEWQARFHTNINEDSRRLAESAQTIVALLEQGAKNDPNAETPQEEVEAFLSAHQFQFEGLENGTVDISDLIANADTLKSSAARFVATGVLRKIQGDIALLPLAQLEKALGRDALDPAALASDLGVPVTTVLRRLAGIEELKAGLVVCDRSGTVIFRKSVPGFSVPRLGAGCPLWPLFAALSQPGMVVRDLISQRTAGADIFDAFAATDQVAAPGYNCPPLVQSVMLLVSKKRASPILFDPLGPAAGFVPNNIVCHAESHPCCKIWSDAAGQERVRQMVALKCPGFVLTGCMISLHCVSRLGQGPG